MDRFSLNAAAKGNDLDSVGALYGIERDSRGFYGFVPTDTQYVLVFRRRQPIDLGALARLKY